MNTPTASGLVAILAFNETRTLSGINRFGSGNMSFAVAIKEALLAFK